MISALSLLALVAADAKMDETDEARRVMAKYSDCLVNRLGFKLRKVLDRPVGDQDTKVEMILLNDSDCLLEASDTPDSGGASLRFNNALMRGSVYASFYAKEFAAQPAMTFDDIPPLNYPTGPVYASKPVPLDVARYALQMDVGDCVVRRAPQQARSLLATPVTGGEERAALTALMPAIQACAYSGRTLTLSKAIVRGMVAEPLYRLTAAKRKMSNAPR